MLKESILWLTIIVIIFLVSFWVWYENKKKIVDLRRRKHELEANLAWGRLRPPSSDHLYQLSEAFYLGWRNRGIPWPECEIMFWRWIDEELASLSSTISSYRKFYVPERMKAAWEELDKKHKYRSEREK